VRGPDTERFAATIAAGGVAIFPADTVYGLACDPGDEAAVARLYDLKERPPGKPSAVMFFELEPALEGVPPRTRAVLERLLPGPLTALVANPAHRYPLACGTDPGVLGIRLPVLPRLAGAPPVLQSSANVAGGPEPRRLEEVPRSIREDADLEIDGGEVHGVPSTVVDLAGFEESGEWRIVRPGAVDEQTLRAAIS
jgi:L-threonylcarbamoyladenylate synthase